MAKRKKSRKVSGAAVVNTLCKIGTVAHNRPFTPRDLTDYGGSASALSYLRRAGFISGKRSLYPTKKGWRAVELACALSHKKR